MHYVCLGECGGVSKKPGVCQDPDCPRRGEPLTSCHCKDPGHHKEGEPHVHGHHDHDGEEVQPDQDSEGEEN